MYLDTCTSKLICLHSMLHCYDMYSIRYKNIITIVWFILSNGTLSLWVVFLIVFFLYSCINKQWLLELCVVQISGRINYISLFWHYYPHDVTQVSFETSGKAHITCLIMNGSLYNSLMSSSSCHMLLWLQ